MIELYRIIRKINVSTLALLLLLFVHFDVHAQRARVTGTVTDETGATIPGANILVQGTTRGVSTDLDGSFAIDVEPNNRLIVSFLGFEEQTVEVGSQTVINVTLKEKGNVLDEVTIVGYGTQRKASVIGAISTVDVADLRMPVGKVSTSLAGRLAGVVSMQRSGEPGAGADFWIRGVNTFGAHNRPLVLVDGVERALDLVDTEDIESFSTLKDATATAVYGVRGANGVILITTRRGKEGKPQVSARVESGVLAPTKMPVMAKSEDFMKLLNDVYREINDVDYYSPELMQKHLSNEDPDLYPNVDWMKVIYKDWTTSSRVNLNVTGGGSAWKYYVAGSYYTENGIFNADTEAFNPEMKWTKYSFRSNVDINLTKSTVVSLNLSTQYDVKNRPRSSSDLFVNTYVTNPVIVPPIYSDRTVARAMAAGTNPYNTLNKTGYVQEFNNNSQTLVGLGQDFSEIITDGLRGNIKFSWDVVNNSSVTRRLDPTTFFATGRDEDGNLIFHQNSVGSANSLQFERYGAGTRAMYLEASLTYDRVFGNVHRVGGLFLFNTREATEIYPGNHIASIPSKNLGIAGRATYSYMDKYFIEGNFGYNGSENFAPGYMFGFFPSIALGYIISEERFFEPFTNVVSMLKLKGSHGKIGNDRIGGDRRFGFNSEMEQNAAGYRFGLSGENSLTGIATGYPGNPFVSWEESVKSNIGFEIELYRKLKLHADFFHEDRNNIFILRQSVPSVVGVNVQPWINIGRMENKGVDMTLEYAQSFSSDFFLSIRGTMTWCRNLKLYDDIPKQAYEYLNEVGRPLYQQMGLISLGYFESWEDIENSATQSFGPVRPGDVKFRDINGDGVVDRLDRVAMGRTHVPELNFGFGASSQYKQFDFSFFFSGVSMVTGFIDGSPINGFEQNIAMAGVFEDVARNRWTEENPNPNATYPRMAIAVSQNNKQLGSHKLRDMGFVRLKNMELGYTVPKNLTAKFRMNSCRIYLQGFNLLTFAPFKLWDPEIGNSQGAVYPNMRTLNLGINLTF
jgi:TonB-linked SusC/RagA family outer membrane protein